MIVARLTVFARHQRSGREAVFDGGMRAYRDSCATFHAHNSLTQPVPPTREPTPFRNIITSTTQCSEYRALPPSFNFAVLRHLTC